MRRVYVDTCLLIYWVEGAGLARANATRWLEQQTDASLCISALVRLEALVKPLQTGNVTLVQAYETLLSQQQWLSIDDTVFAKALELRVQWRLKTPDALHLATAMRHGCSELWTNDDRLQNAAGHMKAMNVVGVLS